MQMWVWSFDMLADCVVCLCAAVVGGCLAMQLGMCSMYIWRRYIDVDAQVGGNSDAAAFVG